MIISNPPFKKIVPVLTRLYELGKPFAMIVNWNPLFDSKERYSLFKSYDDIQLLIPAKRIKFFTPAEGEGRKGSSPAFKSIYVCRNILPKQICFE